MDNEGLVIDEVIEPVVEVKEEEEQVEPKEEPKKLNRNDISFEVDKENKVEIDYARFNFTDEKIEALTPSVERFQEMGMTNDQIEAVLEEMDEDDDFDPMQNLKDNLTDEEKKNYNKINSYANKLFEGSAISEEMLDDLMLEPLAVKAINELLKKSNGKQARTRYTKPVAPLQDNTEEIEGKILDVLRSVSFTTDERNAEIERLLKSATNKEYAQRERKFFFQK